MDASKVVFRTGLAANIRVHHTLPFMRSIERWPGSFFNPAQAKLNLFLGDDRITILLVNQKGCKSLVVQPALLYHGAYLGA